MFSKVISIALFAAVARLVSAAGDDFVFQTPKLVQCKDAKLEWKGGNAAYAVYVVPFNDPCGDAVAEVGVTPNEFKTWKVTAPAGSKVQLLVEDSDANEAWTGIVTVEDSDDKSCVDAKGVEVLQSAGALPGAAAPEASASSGSTKAAAAASSAAAAASSGAAPAGYSPAIPSKSVADSGAAGDGIANAAAPGSDGPTSGSIPRAAIPAASLIGLTTLLFTLFQL